MSGRLLNRSAALVIAKSSRDRFFVTTDSTRITGLRVAFQIEKTLRAEPNTATIQVFNLAETTRALLRERPLTVTLEAGYDGDLARAFVGDLTFAVTTGDGPDLLTKIQAGDGARAIGTARVSRSFRAGTDARTVVKEAAGAMGLRIPTSLDDVSELQQQFASGVTVEGLSRKELTRILGAKGFDWSVQDGSLAVHRSNDTRGGEAIVFTTSTALGDGLQIIGSPEEGAPTKETKVPTLKFRAQLTPFLLPGARIQVRSREVGGFYRCERVGHLGDTGGGDWHTEIEAKPL